MIWGPYYSFNQYCCFCPQGKIEKTLYKCFRFPHDMAMWSYNEKSALQSYFRLWVHIFLTLIYHLTLRFLNICFVFILIHSQGYLVHLFLWINARLGLSTKGHLDMFALSSHYVIRHQYFIVSSAWLWYNKEMLDKFAYFGLIPLLAHAKCQIKAYNFVLIDK